MDAMEKNKSKAHENGFVLLCNHLRMLLWVVLCIFLIFLPLLGKMSIPIDEDVFGKTRKHQLFVVLKCFSSCLPSIGSSVLRVVFYWCYTDLAGWFCLFCLKLMLFFLGKISGDIYCYSLKGQWTLGVS